MTPFTVCVKPGSGLSRRRRALGHVTRASAGDIQLPDALLFDCDGVLVDTEAEGHRVAFNQAFKEKGESLHSDVWSCLQNSTGLQCTLQHGV